MSGIYTKDGLCVYWNKGSKNKAGVWVREGKECDYTKSGDISNVSWVVRFTLDLMVTASQYRTGTKLYIFGCSEWQAQHSYKSKYD